MTWNYRVIRHADGSLALHEVYYDEAGQPCACTRDPVGFAVEADEGLAGLTASLERALRDAKQRPILDINEIPRSKAGSTDDVIAAEEPPEA